MEVRRMGARVERDGAEVVETDVPMRMDRLPWSRWHWMVVVALGITWVLDGLEVTIVGAIAAVLTNKQTLALSDFEIGLVGGVYIAGAVFGAFLFGYLTDRLGRKRLFMWTLLLYLLATVATAFSWTAAVFFVFRFLTGMGIGGEYAAINSATEELNPARVRGRVELAINGSWWLGTAAGAALTVLLLQPKLLPVDIGWRVAFALGAVIGIAVLLIRRLLPESPRWLMTHNREEEAERVVRDIEEQVKRYKGLDSLPEPEGEPIEIRPRDHTPVREILRTMFRDNKKRTVLGLSLMAAQAFIYNAVFFTFGLVLTTFFKVPDQNVGLFILPFAVGNFLGPFLLGPLFDSVGRRAMIAFSYIVSGVLLVATGLMFANGVLFTSDLSLTIAWSVIFFFASAGASAGYLTVSEIFPLEIRANAIAFFFAIGTGVGGIIGPLLFGYLVGTGSKGGVAVGYLVGAAAMILAGIVEVVLGVDAEQKPLEEVAEPLSAESDTASVSEGGRQEASAPPGSEERRAG
jgi:MFS family permease